MLHGGVLAAAVRNLWAAEVSDNRKVTQAKQQTTTIGGEETEDKRIACVGAQVNNLFTPSANHKTHALRARCGCERVHVENGKQHKEAERIRTGLDIERNGVGVGHTRLVDTIKPIVCRGRATAGIHSKFRTEHGATFVTFKQTNNCLMSQ